MENLWQIDAQEIKWISIVYREVLMWFRVVKSATKKFKITIVALGWYKYWLQVQVLVI